MLKSKLMSLHIDIGFLLIVIVFLCQTIPLIFFDIHDGASYNDHIKFHLPSVLKIREHWPYLDIREDTLSAIAPGYYYFLATVSIFTGNSEINIRITNLIVSGLVPLTLYIYMRSKDITLRNALLVLLPLVTSNFFIKSSIWIMTDNASLMLVVLFLLCIFDNDLNNLNSIKIGILGSIATFFRQINFWVVIPSLLQVLLSDNKGEFEMRREMTSNWLYFYQIFKSKLILFIAALLPCFVIGFLYFSWGGLVPPRWVNASQSFSLCSLAYILSIFAILGSCYFWNLIRVRINQYIRNPIVIFSIISGIAISLISPTTFNPEAGRWGGYFWSVVRILPSFNDRSLFFLFLSPIGASIIAILWLEIRNSGMFEESALWLASLVSWALTFLINRQVFHRYFEREILVFLILAVCLLKGKLSTQHLTIDSYYIRVLTIVQILITLTTILSPSST